LTDVDGVIDVPQRRASHDHASPRHTEPLAQFGSVPTAHTLDMAVARFCVLVQEYCEALRKVCFLFLSMFLLLSHVVYL